MVVLVVVILGVVKVLLLVVKLVLVLVLVVMVGQEEAVGRWERRAMWVRSLGVVGN